MTTQAETVKSQKGSAWRSADLQDLQVQIKEQDLLSDVSSLILCVVLKDDAVVELMQPYIVTNNFTLIIPEGNSTSSGDDANDEVYELEGLLCKQDRGGEEEEEGGLLIQNLSDKQAWYFREVCIEIEDSKALRISQMSELYDVMRYCEKQDAEFRKNICHQLGWNKQKWRKLWKQIQTTNNQRSLVDSSEAENQRVGGSLQIIRQEILQSGRWKIKDKYSDDTDECTPYHFSSSQSRQNVSLLAQKEARSSLQIDKKLSFQWKCFVGILGAVREPNQQEDLSILVESGLLARCLQTLFQDMVGQGSAVEPFMPCLDNNPSQ
eukprot:TRINITY_DN2952_c0_g2_i2.p1 TRINITY_DN2952_c0_g2~~TRINITY_DN2952_c0_g2_i2.p1  ORF type:complete len:346 (-),score=47.41 TRINITY_DN2952_c0_g2_i2:292-1257(-)